MALLLSVLEQGMIYGILALGVYITYKILDFPDLTVDGSFPFGAAITVRLINGFGVPAILTSYCFPRRSTGGNLYRTDPCEIKSQRSALRYHHDDRSVYHQSVGGRLRLCSYF